MAVVAIVAILALMALPGFVDTIIRNQILEALPLADIARKPADGAWATTQTLPKDNAAIGLPPPDRVVSNLVSAMAVQDGVIHITFGNRANALIRGKVVTLRPAIVDDAPVVPVAWVCGYAAPPGNMTVLGENRTTVPQRYLPWKCRAG